MGASREKKMRKNTDPRPVTNPAPAKKATSNTVKWILGIAAAVVIVALMGVSMFFGSDYFYQNTTAVTVGEHEVSPAEFNYYYRETYYRLTQESPDMASYLSYMTDMIAEEAAENVKNVYAIYDTAIAEGYTLTEEEIAELDLEAADMKSTAKAMGALNVDQLLASVYGTGCTEENYRKYREMNTIVSRYTTDVADAQDISADALNAYYAEHAEDLDTVTYRQFFMPLQNTMEETQALAQNVLKEVARDDAAMDKYALEYGAESALEHYATAEDATLLKNISKVSASAEVADWLFDSARTKGDTACIQKADESGVFLLCFLGRDTGNYNTVNVRHILVGIEEGETEEGKKDAKETAQSYLEEFQNGDKTEESFAELAKAYSEDNAEEGGLYENVYKGQMVASFEDWCFDSNRKAGDSGIVETEYGYHIMYFVGEGESYRDTKTKTALLNEFYNTWIEGVTEGYTVTMDEKGMSHVTTDVSTDY